MRGDGRRIVVLADRKARELDLDTGKDVGSPIGTADVIDASFNPAGDSIATVGRDGSVILWTSGTHEPIGAPMSMPAAIRHIAFNANGDRLALATDRQIQVWDVASQRRIGRPLTAKHDIRDVAFLPLDPELIAAGEEVQVGPSSPLQERSGLVELWNVGTGQLDGAPIATPESAWPIAVSPSDRQIVVPGGLGDGWPIQRWDVSTRLTVGEPMAGHGSPVRAIAYSKDGKYIASASGDRTAGVWDAQTGELVLRLRGHGDGVTRIALAVTGTTDW